MIQINVVSRISEDKNAFFDLIYAVHRLKQDRDISNIKLLFIGDIISPTLYRALLQLVDLFDLGTRVQFTKKSIRFTELPKDVKSGYFLNFTVGNFIGFSGIESIRLGFKTLFYNPVKSLSSQTRPSPSQCADHAGLIDLLAGICVNTTIAEELIRLDNAKMKENFSLTEQEESFLNKVISPI